MILHWLFPPLLASLVEAANESCVPTTGDLEGPFYLDMSRKDWDIAPEEELQDKSKEIVLHGQILDEHCEVIQFARVEVWYAGGANGEYTFPPEEIWYRGENYTDETGYYSFHATYPGINLGRPIPHIHFKITVRIGQDFVTQLYFPDDVPTSYEEYVQKRPSQFPQSIREAPDGSRYIQFDIVITPDNLRKEFFNPLRFESMDSKSKRK